MADRVLAACTVVLAAVYLQAASRLPSLEIGDPLGPKAFPVLLGILFALAGVLLALEGLARRRAVAEIPAGPPSRPRAVLVTAGATALLFALLEPLGYLVAMSLYLFGVMRWLHGRGPALCAVVAALFSLASYALFAKALGVTLARGLLHF